MFESLSTITVSVQLILHFGLFAKNNGMEHMKYTKHIWNNYTIKTKGNWLNTKRAINRINGRLIKKSMMSGFLITYKFFPVYSYQDGALQWLIKSLCFYFVLWKTRYVYIFIFKLPDVVQSSEESNKTDIKRTSWVRQLKKSQQLIMIKIKYDNMIKMPHKRWKSRNGENLI